jgi:hypothetical protein
LSLAETIRGARIGPGSVLVLFDDQSSMKIKTASAAAVSSGSKVKSIDEAKAQFKIEFENGLSATLSLADPGLPLYEIKQCGGIPRIRSDDSRRSGNGDLAFLLETELHKTGPKITQDGF